MVIDQLQLDYGDDISIHYFDISDNNIYSEVMALVETHCLPFPLTLINGKIFSAGYISYRNIADKLDQILAREVS